MLGATNDVTSPNISPHTSAPPDGPRELYNAGTRKLAARKFDESETLLRTALLKQDERLQRVALYNLGHVRFAQGGEELKKGPSRKSTTARGESATATGTSAIQFAESALAGNDLQTLVAAYRNGRGARKELRAATEAVQRAMEVYGKTLLKWRRSLGDFQSAAELNPADANALHNAEIVEQAIAKLVDSLRAMQALGAMSASQHAELNELLKQLKGRIPQEMMPPGAPGDEEEDLPMEALRGLKEPPGKEGAELELTLSPEQAGQLLDGIRGDGIRRLPMSQSEKGKPNDRSGRTW